MNGQAGKGDKSRVKDVERYRKNFDAIDWKNKRRGNVSPLYNVGRCKWIFRGEFPPDFK